MISPLSTLADVLLHAGDLDAANCLYLPMNEVWHLGTQCAVLKDSDVHGLPDLAMKHQLSYALGVDAVQDIVANATSQVPGVTADQLLKAFLFYYDHDAFVTVID